MGSGGIPADETKNPEIVVGGWVYTEGVNTAPASDAEKFQLVYEFFTDATQTENVLGEPIIIDFPQEAATTDGWVEISSESIGALIFPEPRAAKSTRVTVLKGASATGTVYLDDLFMGAAEGSEGWVGGFFNANMDVTSDFYYWWDGFDSRAVKG